MALFKSANPALTKDTFEDLEKVAMGEENVMTLQGTVNKTGVLLLAVIIPALYTWDLFTSTLEFANIMPYFWTGTIGCLILAFIIVYNMDWSPFLAPVFAYTSVRNINAQKFMERIGFKREPEKIDFCGEKSFKYKLD